MIRNALKAALHSPVVDLRQSPTAEFFSNAAALSAEQLLTVGEPFPLWVQRRNPPGFRDDVISEAGYEGIPSSDALDLLDDCNAHWGQLPTPLRVSVARTLMQMGEQETVVSLLHGTDTPQLQTLLISAQVALHRTGHLADIDAHGLFDLCRNIGANGAHPIEVRCTARIAAFLLGIQAFAGTDAATVYEELLAIDGELSARGDFAGAMMRSRVWRAAAMYPHSRGDFARMRGQMEVAEQFALEARASNGLEEFLRTENLFSVYESRVKESLAVGDTAAALRFAVRLCELFPTNATARIEYGEVLLASGNASGAAVQYSLAAGYSPPGGAVAWFMAGECFAAAGAQDKALACYLCSSKDDDQAISAIRRAQQRSQASPAAAALSAWAHEALGTLELMEDHDGRC